MKKYSFRLQPVLDIRENVLEDKRLEMAKVIKVLNEQQEVLDGLFEKQKLYKQELDGISLNENLNVYELSNYKDYMVVLAQQIKQQQELIENTQKVLRVKQNDVNMALKEVKVLEKLKEKQSEKFYRDIEMKEANELDDIITSRYKLKRA